MATALWLVAYMTGLAVYKFGTGRENVDVKSPTDLRCLVTESPSGLLVY